MGSAKLEEFFGRGGEDALGGANALHDLERDPTRPIQNDSGLAQGPAGTIRGNLNVR
jgi:hypothetical protein